ncbi:PLD nuclease N-terminal domain-containing protein [Wenyingzhuangia sp. chi5]|uniref:PLD nuclease N-terminal domain-containing protein n=1 Tax=Wenyingzhuangia gilva TaxID=3057677 RepID=A0ABT8VSW2_9FLAO|nr:PLD nuclease N-terminal domain-containing protein [Wenyingzhuangia sp. chi5]MDO3695060.1 PLD nuclease N-terminal domain-containing protein [Wenyingzhuangia sp. chi5]
MMYLGIIGIGELVLVTIMLIVILPTILALIDILKNEFTGNNKIAWLLVVLFTSFIGAILYFIIGRKQKLSNTND